MTKDKTKKYNPRDAVCPAHLSSTGTTQKYVLPAQTSGTYKAFTSSHWLSRTYGTYLKRSAQSIAAKFSQLDLDRSGKLTPQELVPVFSMGSGYIVPLRTVEKLARMFDYGDSKGLITFQEFAALDAYVTSLRNAFCACDREKTGSISFQEVESCFRVQGFKLSEFLLQSLKIGWDREKTGRISYISYMDMAATLGLCRTVLNQFDPRRTGKIRLNFDELVICMLGFK
ncbi:hypothetical protein ADUPG1_007810 [Aduncisulcus paluster]|uniref:EF-hand domain-containing protein n=1 Tax=Aduncisulcus paluster TaxID=2918883 RepID=A0ABQ5KPM1_9EUKA|nr:hypothetical protein ADUPG1_007810 [Aduncisulcus paluster]